MLKENIGRPWSMMLRIYHLLEQCQQSISIFSRSANCKYISRNQHLLVNLNTYHCEGICLIWTFTWNTRGCAQLKKSHDGYWGYVCTGHRSTQPTRWPHSLRDKGYNCWEGGAYRWVRRPVTWSTTTCIKATLSPSASQKPRPGTAWWAKLRSQRQYVLLLL